MMMIIPVAALVAGGLGFLWWEKHHSPDAPRSITLDAGLSDAEKQTIIAAVMSATDPNQLDAMAAQYAGYPYAHYELAYRAWELRGSQGTPPQPPTGPGVSMNLGPQGASVSAQTGPLDTGDLASQATAAAQSLLGMLGGLVDPGVAAASPSTATTPAPAPTANSIPSTAPTTPPAAPPSPPPGVLGDLGAAAAQAAQAAQSVLGGSAGPGWTVIPNGAASLFSWNTTPVLTPAVVAEAQRLLAANLQGSQYEAYQDGSTWRFTRNGGNVVAALGAPGQQTAGQQVGMEHYHDPMAQQPTFMNENQEGVRGVPAGESKEEVAGAPGGESIEEVGGDPLAQLAATTAMAVPVQIAGAAPARPTGGWYITIRPNDRAWPRRIAEIGSGVSRGGRKNLQQLVDMNPQLAQGGIIREFKPGDEVNVPSDWVSHLANKGFQVNHD